MVLVGVAGTFGLIGLAIARSKAAGLAGAIGPWLWTLAVVLIVGVVVGLGWKLFRRPGSIGIAMVAAAVAACMIGAVLVPLQSLVSDTASNLIYAKVSRGGATAAEAGCCTVAATEHLDRMS